MKSVPITETATLFTGLTIRKRHEIRDSGAIRLIQLRSIGEAARIDVTKTDWLEERMPAERQLLLEGDLLLRPRGSRVEAATFVDDGIPTVASAPLIVLRPNPELVLPEYLQWLLNESPEVRRALVASMRGSTVQALNIEDLSRIEVPLPPLDRQKAIVDAAALARHAAELEVRLSELRKIHTAQILSEAARQMTKES